MKVLRIIITALLIGIMAASCWKIEAKLNEYRVAQDVHVKRTLETRAGRKVDFAKLKAENPDTKGWIWLPGTQIDYPIVQGKDNEYYVHHDFDGDYLYDGCIFIDSKVIIPFTAQENTVIYGHRMLSGAMFNNLGKYADEEFFEEHPIIIIETENESYDLHVIAYCEELDNSDLYNTMFDEEPVVTESSINTENAAGEFIPQDLFTKKDFIQLVKDKAVHLADEKFDEDDIYVTLSTCAYASGNERNQVIGILKEAPQKEKTVQIKTDKPLINKWLILQILTGAIAIAITLLAIIPKRKKI